jgi:hypothetical protein
MGWTRPDDPVCGGDGVPRPEPDDALRGTEARLLPDERAELEAFFLDAVDLGRIRLSFGGLGSVGGYARTIGNTIVFPEVYRSGYSRLARRCWLVHEVTHVWQNQVLGKRYIAGALWEHLSRLWCRDPYHFELFPPRGWLSYGYEAQASLMEALYRMRSLGATGRDRVRLEELHVELRSVRRAAPGGRTA